MTGRWIRHSPTLFHRLRATVHTFWEIRWGRDENGWMLRLGFVTVAWEVPDEERELEVNDEIAEEPW